MKSVVLTGIRSNNKLTLGNYLGAISPLIRLIDGNSSKYQINLFVPDLHSFTTPIQYDQLYANTLAHIRSFIAFGIDLADPDLNIYRQSYISAHSELTWILECFSSFGELSRMIQFKEKSLQNKNPSVGLFNYPVLMAADILLYNADYVPVGEDQMQHLEYTRNLAIRFNNKFGDIFKIPKTVQEQSKFFNQNEGLKIKDLANPEIKMSKSNDNSKGVIFLEDSVEISQKKINQATTDNLRLIAYNPKEQPGITNLLTILALLEGQDPRQVAVKYKGVKDYSVLKSDVSNAVTGFIKQYQSRYSSIDPNTILNHLEKDENKMNVIANETLLKVQRAVGLRP